MQGPFFFCCSLLSLNQHITVIVTTSTSMYLNQLHPLISLRLFCTRNSERNLHSRYSPPLDVSILALDCMKK